MQRRSENKKTLVFLLLCGIYAILYSFLWGYSEFTVYSLRSSGINFPSNPVRLSNQLKGFLNNASRNAAAGETIGLIVPYGNYIYCGPVAASAYKQIEGEKYDFIIVLTSSKSSSPKSKVYSGKGITTPLGFLSIDVFTTKRLLNLYPALFEPITDELIDNAALESQLPFIHYISGNVKIVPIEVSNGDFTHLKKTSDALTSVSNGKKILVIASSNLSVSRDYREAIIKDKHFSSLIPTLKPEQIYKDMTGGGFDATDGSAILTMMMTVLEMGVNDGVVLRYFTSADLSGDLTRVTGYMSASFLKHLEVPQVASVDDNELKFTDKEADCLFNLVESSLRSHLMDGDSIFDSPCQFPAFYRKHGLIVSYSSRGEFRGCIGDLYPSHPLHVFVDEVAIAAAFHDPRCNPIAFNELQDLTIEICITGDPIKIKNLEDLDKNPDYDGIFLKNGTHSSLVIPKNENMIGWDNESILQRACLKAGLASTCYKNPGTEIYIFEAKEFSKSLRGEYKNKIDNIETAHTK
ncbi:AmmeMemoRadiSam system protein B [bacterium]|nr:AmmeMemoRadiSam system protein B [bacterium]